MAALLISALLFPVTLNYLSPYLSVLGPAQGIINGSLIIFAGLFVSSLFFGRFWCGWLCPAGAIQEAEALAQPKPFKGGWRDAVKYVLWAVWLTLVVFMLIAAGGIAKVDFIFMTESVVSLGHPFSYFIYYGVILIFTGIAALAGKRGACHTICWMAPFMVIGERLSRLLRLPRLRLKAKAAQCVQCGQCTRVCAMSLPVQTYVQDGRIEDTECIKCMKCADVCPKDVIEWGFFSDSI